VFHKWAVKVGEFWLGVGIYPQFRWGWTQDKRDRYRFCDKQSAQIALNESPGSGLKQIVRLRTK